MISLNKFNMKSKKNNESKRLYIIFFLGLILIASPKMLFGQLGNSCGIPTWHSTLGYMQNSFVKHNSTVYRSNVWSSGETPGISSSWVDIGSCNESLIIAYPELAYTNCSGVNDWDNSVSNYNTDDLVLYQNGVYRAKYWVAGADIPDNSEAYEFKGICVIPIAINPQYSNNSVIVQPALSTINLTATYNNYGFSNVQNKIKIKPILATSFSEFDMSVSTNTLSYLWTPNTYGDYNIIYRSVNAVGVITEVSTIIKVAISEPPLINITYPQNNSVYNQLSFSPISIVFTVEAFTGNTISNINFIDETANNISNIPLVSGSNYTYNWTPQNYGLNVLKIRALDNQGTQKERAIQIRINNPAFETISFANLPNQIKMINGIQKTFVFDKTITQVIKRDPTLITHIINNNQITFSSTRPGRSGLKITTSDNQVYFVGLRVDNSNGTVPKYPNHVAVGSVSEDIDDDVNFYNNGMDNTNLLKNNRMDVRYIYINGGPLIGWNTWQPDRAKKFTKNSLKMGLVPFFIFYNIPDGGESYTTDLEHIRNPSYMTAYFQNIILFLNDVKSEVGDEFFGVILEPDFLGYMQQNSEPITSATSVTETSIGLNIGTLQSLVHRINKTFNDKRLSDNLNFEFGWQFNLWAKPNVAGIRGIIRETDTGNFNVQLNKIIQTAKDIYDYGNNVGVMSHNADFVSIDKYGLDALGYSNSSNPADPSSYTWFWNNDHWNNYLKFVNKLKIESGKHVILWQIPVGHINGSTTINQYTNTNFVLLNNTSKRYEDSATTFFFGDNLNFSNDLARFNYFSQNLHNDSKLVANSATKVITFGNHFQEVYENGTKLILMGAGVGDSTDGIGLEGVTLTDDHFWIQKLQDYYINHLVEVLGINTEGELLKDDVVIFPNPVEDILNYTTTESIESIEIFNLNYSKILSVKTNLNQINVQVLSKGLFLAVFKTIEGKYIIKKMIKI